MLGTIIRAIEGDTRSLDNGSHSLGRPFRINPLSKNHLMFHCHQVICSRTCESSWCVVKIAVFFGSLI